MPRQAMFRFYEELNDFLPEDKRKITFTHEFTGKPSIKDVIEAIGIPHTEVDLILINGKSVTFSYHLQNGDMVSVYPVFESLDISNVTHLREKPLRKPRFILDVHLGKLAKYLRMLGFDTLYDNDYDDSRIIELADEEKRTILTRDVGLLKNNTVTHGYWIRALNSEEQLKEVISRFDLSSSIKSFSRCTVCNGKMQCVAKESVMEQLKPKTRQYYNEFYQCSDCGKIYWKGSHYNRMKDFIGNLKKINL
ncbi:MAG: Mut7-C ubiquitin/RNAse domain-containing protein [Candidatus Latescibacteria bacterium]|jgi:uncharacterized protein|nr:Mut7-C ubiquitin/RNAse domain-containing protein [Candidatus Latescibacterota bacterium]